MKTIIRIIVTCVFLIVPFAMSAEDRDYFFDATKAYKEGRYQDAIELYKAAKVFQNKNVDAEIKNCREKINLKSTTSTGTSIPYRLGSKINLQGKSALICFLDSTGKHGWGLKESSRREEGWRIPDCDEIEIIYKNRHKLRIDGAYRYDGYMSVNGMEFIVQYVKDFRTGENYNRAEYSGNVTTITIADF